MNLTTNRFRLLTRGLGALGMSVCLVRAGDPTGFLAQLVKLPDAKQQTGTVDGFTLAVIDLGKGTLVACPTASVDRTAYLSSDFAAWHAKLKAALNK